MQDNQLICYNRRFWIVFEDDTNVWWLRWLRRGFRHCYVLIPLLCPSQGPAEGKDSASAEELIDWDLPPQGYLLELNPMFNIFVTAIRYVSYEEFLHKLRLQGRTICEVVAENPPPRVAPHFLFDCVEVAKRLLGWHRRGIFTPYQLYKNICNCRKKILTK